ncbi:MAG: prepilin-type N-terminal cleavage/methylation domain-containing protein [Spirochaetes bacterium]|nr:prepilin-type N-terminal cleavage/methylation domain-containing protein [Spirochaetota bacterium]
MKRSKPHYNALRAGKPGFVLVEILIALAILSTVLLSVISGVSSSVYVISGMKNYTQAMLVARTKMNEFIVKNFRGTDLKDEQIKGLPGFYVSRETTRWEHPLLGPLPANITSIIVSWKERGKERSYKISYVYQAQ